MPPDPRDQPYGDDTPIDPRDLDEPSFVPDHPDAERFVPVEEDSP